MGINDKKWRSVGDPQVRDSHLPLEPITGYRLHWPFAKDQGGLGSAAVVRIESAAFGARAWSRSRLLDTMRCTSNLGLLCSPTFEGAAGWTDNQACGFMIYGLRQGHYELMRFAVDPFHRRCGAATAMIALLHTKLRATRPAVRCEVPDDNLAAQLFLKDAGFVATGVAREQWPVRDRYLFRLSHETLHHKTAQNKPWMT